MKTSGVDQFLEKMTHWKSELTRLRELALECGLEETLKWGQPCYTHKGANVLLLGNFKDFCTISFFKGVLLNDPAGILEKAGENSRIARIIKFTQLSEISERWDVLKSYIFEAIEIENTGLKVEKQAENIQDFVKELQNRLSTDQKFATAFTALTPGRQRAYNIYFSAAKQATTREARIDKYTDRILKGFGFHDCVCGLSKKMPRCDGSHKQLQK
ncbi:DUF1801 domain-containing protein [Euzebyella saccharophila]|uniref:DUF1801 domain-containing protein n=1 Tax=Euzebyella saccharophila TaxID=679664 RepID=A0ABV8JV83_9FLAO|nr:DUF1801 domain-containing protein [Euzebyella saccharophila]